jgi:hypothetical protein
MRAPRLRRPRTLLALTAALVGFGVFSSAIGSGALPAESLPAFGVTTGSGSLSTVAELGDVDGDGFGDYAIGLPSANSDAGMVYVFLGHGGPLPASPTAVDLATASFTITGHASEMLGYAIVGNDVNDDGLADVAIGAPMAGAPAKAGGGAVYVVFGRASPVDVNTTSLSGAALTTDPAHPTSTIGSRYDGFQQNSHTGMALAALPDVNGDGIADLAVGAPDADLHITGGGGVAVLYGRREGVHITLNDLWEKSYPYFFHIDFPALAGQHVGTSVAAVGDMTGDGLPDIAIGAPQADFNGADSGSVWIISAHIAPIVGCTQPVPPETAIAPGSVCPWIKLNGLTAGQGYRIDGAAPGDQLGSSLAGFDGGSSGDVLAIGAAGASPNGRAGSGEIVVVPRQSGQATRNLAVTPPLQSFDGAEVGAGLGASLAAAGVIGGSTAILAGAPGEASGAGAAYLLRFAPGAISDLALASAKTAPAGAGAMAGSAVAAGTALDGGSADALVAAPGAAGNGAWYAVGGSGTPILPPPPPPPSPPPAPPAPPAAPPTTPGATPGTTAAGATVGHAPSTISTPASAAKRPVAKKKRAKLPLCPLKKSKPRYHMVNGKRVKMKPRPCRPRAKSKLKAT